MIAQTFYFSQAYGIKKLKFSHISLGNSCYILKGVMEASYLLTQAYLPELGGGGSFFGRKRLDLAILAGFLDTLEMLC